MISPCLDESKGHGIIGERGFVDAVRDRYLSPSGTGRELPAAQKLSRLVEPGRIIEVVCAELKVRRGGLLRKRYRGAGRGLLMEMLYRYGRLKQPQIGAMPGIDYSIVSIGRRRFFAIRRPIPNSRLCLRRCRTDKFKDKDLSPCFIYFILP